MIDPGPHKVGKQIEVKCIIDRIYPCVSSSSFNITLTNHEVSFLGEVDSVVENVPSMVVHGFINASLDYDNEYVICHVTTAAGKYIHRQEHLKIYGKL